MITYLLTEYKKTRDKIYQKQLLGLGFLLSIHTVLLILYILLFRDQTLIYTFLTLVIFRAMYFVSGLDQKNLKSDEELIKNRIDRMKTILQSPKLSLYSEKKILHLKELLDMKIAKEHKEVTARQNGIYIAALLPVAIDYLGKGHENIQIVTILAAIIVSLKLVMFFKSVMDEIKLESLINIRTVLVEILILEFSNETWNKRKVRCKRLMSSKNES